jgi:hypothetical protein
MRKKQKRKKEKEKGAEDKNKDKGSAGSGGEQTPRTGQTYNQKIDSARRALLLVDEKHEKIMAENPSVMPQCVHLLKAMELSESENEDEDHAMEDLMALPEEWLYAESTWGLSRRSSDHNISQDFSELDGKWGEEQVGEVEKKATEFENNIPEAAQINKQQLGKTWGPMIVERRSKRNESDTRTTLERAQEIKRKWEEEGTKGKTLKNPCMLLLMTSNFLLVSLVLLIRMEILLMIQL